MRTSPALLVAESSGISECLDRLAARKRLNRPVSTYRVQLNQRLRFEDARALVGYLHALGISHLYASPILQARAGSMHGYDITDHNRINPEIGSEDEFHALIRSLQERGMGFVLDFVPNHMGVGHGTNPWWQDLLENGRTSEYASFFDIDWEPLKPELKGKVLIPILGDQYGKELESGNIRVGFEKGRFFLQYYEMRLPVDPQTLPMIFAPLGDFHRRHTEWTGEQANRDITEIEGLLAALRHLPSHNSSDADLAQQRRGEAPPLLARFHAIYDRSPRVRELVKEALETINGQPGNPRSYDPLHRLLEAQAYRLAHWRVSAEEINYRRFFDINDLVGLRMENPQVFAATHRLLRKLIADGSITGIRVDHPDGLFNPRQYFTRVQMLYAAAHCCGPEPQPPVGDNGIECNVQEIFGAHDWMNQQAPLYVLIEKILEPGEQLPRAWPVDGTTGYDFTNQVNGIFLDRRNERAFTTLYHRFIGGAPDVDDLIYESKKLIMHTALSSEVTVLSHMLDEIAAADRTARDFTHKALLDAIRETIACFPVYRTYIDERGEISERDRSYIHEAVVRAKRRNEGTASAVFDFLREILLLREAGARSADGYRKRLFFTLKFQQLTGPVMAKGLEDTVCYVYNRFVSLNEVGGSPRQFGVSVDDFHAANQERQQAWPFGMLSTSTHDTKRSEDVRARLNVLSEMPRAWSSQVLRWRRTNRSRKRVLGDGRTVPDLNEEYLLYQTLVGAWPFDLRTDKQRKRFIERIQSYMGKAVHEAKVNLSWINPNAEYTAALDEFITRLLTPGTRARPNAFLEDMRHLMPAVSLFGAVNSLAQTLLKIASPGTPDIYQGSEMWDLSLVDPDNRRPVDFALRQRYLDELLRREAEGDLLSLCAELLRSYQDGRVKMWVTLRAMRFRRENSEAFQTGAYQPLFATGSRRDDVVAFARNHGPRLVIVAVPRLSYTLMNGRAHWPLAEAWGDTELPLPARSGGDFQNLFTGEVLRLTGARAVSCRELFAHFPVALLASS